MSKNTTQHRWPEGAIVYQIYPRSFYDSNNDGVGDIAGITQKLDYIKSLSVNAIWLSPFYPSPMADFGYDVADYCDVDPIFGNLNDMKELIKKAHDMDIKLMVDLVPNHSSDEHEWFKSAKKSKDSPYSDWYIWRDAKGYEEDGTPIPPNNWIEVLGGDPAWEWVPEREQFYLHSFHIRQPDLNWANADVREAIKEAMRFWLDLGVDGFRIDAVHFMAKDPLLRDEPKNPKYKEGKDNRYSALEHLNNHGWPQLHSYLSQMAAVLKEEKYLDSPRFMVTEAYPETHEPVEEYLQFYQGMDPQVAAPFNFEGLGLPWTAKAWNDFLSKFHEALDSYSPLCVASYAFGNHDQHRIVSRVGEPTAKSMAVMLMTLPGMAFVYNGEELGMKNGEIPEDMIQDPGARGGDGRDPERTPLHWTAGKNAGFTEAEKPWLPIVDNYKEYNIETESEDYHSFLSLYRFLGKLRNESESIKHGSFAVIDTKDSEVLGYVREQDGEKHTVLINFSDKVRPLDESVQIDDFVISSDANSKIYKNVKRELLPHEAVVLKAK